MGGILKKEKSFLTDFAPSNDYKMDYVEMEARKDFESSTNWLYLGANAASRNFAKIGITMGDLSSRSYGTVDPNYYLFCAFKARHNISLTQLEVIESNILDKFENMYRNDDGSSKRMRHYDSGRSSECFSPVDFMDFFRNLHLEIYENYRDKFVICGKGVDGEFVDCIFNKKVKNEMEFINMIVQY